MRIYPDTENLKKLEEILGELFDTIWDMEKDEQEEIKNNRPGLWRYLEDTGVVEMEGD